LTWLGFLREVFLANHLASTENLTRTTKTEHIASQANITQEVANKQSKTISRER